jgi:DNA helicase HerA-like ATPase
MSTDFRGFMQAAYDFPPERSLLFGAPLLDGQAATGVGVRMPLAMANRHGLIAGATGTGKTKTLQGIAGALSAAGVPVFLADMKGDLTGMAVGGTSNAKVDERHAAIGVPFEPAGFPVEYLSLTGRFGHPVRATVSSFGPLLLGRVLELNETQRSALAMVFQFCDDQGLLLLDLADLKEVLLYLTEDGAPYLRDYGNLSKATVGVLVRKLVELEQQGGEALFGEPEFDIDDLLQVDADGRGRVSILELSDLHDRPALFSTFMMWLLATLFRELPEAGDLEKPKLVFFFDEAHHLFEGRNKAFTDQIEQVVRLIRSKGVGVWFVTQSPRDLPADILAQLGNRVQHALRAFTPDDEKAVKAAARTMPKSEFYDVADQLTKLGIGEAFVTVLDPKGVPTPVAATLLVAPASSMEPLPVSEVARRVQASPLFPKYDQAIDRVSAREMLQSRVAEADALEAAAQAEAARESAARRAPAPRPTPAPRARRPEPGAAETILKSPVARAATRELVRGIFGLLGVSTSRRRRS